LFEAENRLQHTNSAFTLGEALSPFKQGLCGRATSNDQESDYRKQMSPHLFICRIPLSEREGEPAAPNHAGAGSLGACGDELKWPALAVLAAEGATYLP